jgi:homoserine kinase
VTRSTATAPGSSANLGPGFDCLGVAVELRCRVTVEISDEWTVAEVGRVFAPRPRDYVRRAVTAAIDHPVRMEIHNDVPRSRGLGSSAAVMVAAAAAAMRASGEEPDSAHLYEIVAAIEGHGDNAGAAVYGGLVAVADGTLRHLELAPELRFVFGIPDEPLKTTKARHALPDQISREAAARNVARMAFLLEGLRTADPAAFAHSGGDEIHESHRAPLSPVTGRLMEEARAAGALHAAWSGAGPTAVAVTLEPEPVVAAMQAVLGNRGRALVLDVAAAGWG